MSRFFDDEGINALKKAIRSEQDTSQVKSLFTIDVEHVVSGYSKQYLIYKTVKTRVWVKKSY